MLEERWQETVCSVQDAGLEPSGWETAIENVVSLCGGRVGHLLTIGGPDWLQTNVFTGAPEGSIDYLLQHGVADPRTNPRVKHVLLQDNLTCQNDLQILKPGERDRNPLYRELDRLDTGYGCWTMIMRDGPLNVALAMGSEASRADAQPHDEAAFMLFARMIKKTVNFQIGLQASVEGSYCDALDKLSMPVLLISPSGRLNRTNSSGETFLRRANCIGIRQGRVVCANERDGQKLFSAIDAVLSGVAVGAVTVALGDVQRGITLVDLTIVRPTAWSTTRLRQVMAVIRTSRPAVTIASAQALAGPANLTKSEVDVAILLAQAVRPEQIAINRRVSIGTIRHQIKSIYQKLEIQSFGDLIRIVEGLGRRSPE